MRKSGPKMPCRTTEELCPFPISFHSAPLVPPALLPTLPAPENHASLHKNTLNPCPGSPMKTTGLKLKFQKDTSIPGPSLLPVYTVFTYSAGPSTAAHKHAILHKNTFDPNLRAATPISQTFNFQPSPVNRSSSQHFRRKYLIFSLLSVTELRTAISRSQTLPCIPFLQVAMSLRRHVPLPRNVDFAVASTCNDQLRVCTNKPKPEQSLSASSHAFHSAPFR